MAKVPYSLETLPKISIVWVGRTNVTDRRQTDDRRQTTDRQTDGRQHIANMNLSSRSLKTYLVTYLLTFQHSNHLCQYIQFCSDLRLRAFRCYSTRTFLAASQPLFCCRLEFIISWSRQVCFKFVNTPDCNTDQNNDVCAYFFKSTS